jgi:hypothetical protein
MADVFISYASEDRDRAANLASALGEGGWSVWWDRKIVAGQAFDQVIERELETAKSVVVLWSIHSVESEWVKNEASAASERRVLVPALIDNVRLPLEFRRKQTADLIGWDGDTSHGGFHALCEGIAATMGSAAPPLATSPKVSTSNGKPLWLWPAIAGVVIVMGFFAFALRSWQTSPPRSQIDSSETSKRSESKSDEGVRPHEQVGELADLVVGNYDGDVIADSKGSSQSDIAVTVAKIDRLKVRVVSDYPRIGAVEITLTRTGNQIINAGGDTPFMVDLDRSPATLLLDPRGEIAYRGIKQPEKAAPEKRPLPKPLKLTVTTDDKADQIQIISAPINGPSSRVKVCLQVQTSSGWWKGIGLNEREPTLAGQKSDGLKCTTIAPRLLKVTYWKAKILGVHTPVGTRTLDLRPYKEHAVTFTWRKD